MAEQCGLLSILSGSEGEKDAFHLRFLSGVFKFDSFVHTIPTSPNPVNKRRLTNIGWEVDPGDDSHQNETNSESYLYGEEIDGKRKESILHRASNKIELNTGVELVSPVFEPFFVSVLRNLENLMILLGKSNNYLTNKLESEREDIAIHSVAYSSPNMRKKRILSSLNSTGNLNVIQQRKNERETLYSYIAQVFRAMLELLTKIECSESRDCPDHEELTNIKGNILATVQDLCELLKDVKGEQHETCSNSTRTNEDNTADIEFESIFPLKSQKDLEDLELLISENKNNFQNRMISWFKRLLSSATSLETFVPNAWKKTVADSLGRNLNWEGRYDRRIQGGKNSVKNSQLVQMMKIALQSDPRYSNCLTLDVDFKKKTNNHFRNSLGRFARAHPNHPDVVKWWRLRRIQQESKLSESTS